jgi:hypothetical protein
MKRLAHIRAADVVTPGRGGVLARRDGPNPSLPAAVAGRPGAASVTTRPFGGRLAVSGGRPSLDLMRAGPVTMQDPLALNSIPGLEQLAEDWRRCAWIQFKRLLPPPHISKWVFRAAESRIYRVRALQRLPRAVACAFRVGDRRWLAQTHRR